MEPYQAPSQTRIGHVHLKVSNLQRALDFYCGLLGFELITMYGDQAAFISAGGYHHHIGLNTWHSKDAPPATKGGVGLYHTAILYPTRKDLAVIYKRIKDAHYQGVELYWDKPKEQWPKKPDGTLAMYTRPLDVKNLMSELEGYAS